MLAPPRSKQLAEKMAQRMRRHQTGKIKASWDLEIWPHIDQVIPSSVLRANPERYGRPIDVDPAVLAQIFNPRLFAPRMLGFDETPDPNWVNNRIAKMLGLSGDEGPLRLNLSLGYNLVDDNGENLTVKLLTGNAATALNNANAFLGVTSNASAATETDTSVPSATWVAMNATFPVNPAGSSFALQSDFTGGVANFAWNRWGIGNGSNPGTVGILFSNKTESLGTKSGGTWTLTATVSAD